MDPAISLFDIYLKGPKSIFRKDLCAPMFTAALFTSVKFWKQPKCLRAGDQLKKLCRFLMHMCTKELYSSVSKSRIMQLA